MSVHFTSPIWLLELPPGAKFILLKFGDNANDDGFAWPSIARVASETGFGESTVREKVRTFRDDRVLVRKRGGRGGRAPDDEDGRRHGSTVRYFIDMTRARELYRSGGPDFGAGAEADKKAAQEAARVADLEAPNPPDSGAFIRAIDDCQIGALDKP